MKPLSALRVLVAALALALAGCGSGGSDLELIAAAKVLLDKKDSKGAVIQLKNALQKNPNSAEARFLLGKTLLDGGDPVAALVELRKSQELQMADEQVIPELAHAMLAIGEESKVIAQYAQTRLKDDAAAADLKTSLAAAYAVQGNSDKALQASADALRSRPGYAPAMIVQARLNAAQGDLDGALRTLDEVLAKEAGNERAGYLKGEILWQGKKDSDAALEVFRKIVAAHPASVAAQAAVVNILIQRKELGPAKTAFESLKKAAPKHPETLLFEAQFAYAEGQYARTREICADILKSMPENVRVLELAGAAAFRMKEFVQAEAFLSHALKNAPRVALTRQMLAQTYLRSAQPEKAVEALQPIIEGSKADGTSLSLAGEAYLQSGDMKRSDDAFQRALKAAPGDARVRTSAAMAQMARGNNSGAIAELESIASGDGNPRADLALISARLRQNDSTGALKAIDALQVKLPDQALPLILRGRVQMLKKDPAAARTSFEAALAKEPSNFQAMASLASLDFGAGKPEEARKRIEAYLQAQPKSTQAKLALAELGARTGAPSARVTETIREATRLDPTQASPHLILIDRLLGSGDPKAALAAAQEANAALPNSLEILAALGRAQIAAGDGQRAVSTFTRLAGLQPRNPVHEVHLADAYLLAQDRTAAAGSLRRALELQPDLPAARRGLALLAVMDKRPQDGIAIAREMQQRNPKDGAGYAVEAEIESGRKNWDAAAAAYRAALLRTRTTEIAVKLHSALLRGGKTGDAERLAADWVKDSPRDAAFRYYLGDLALTRNEYARAEGLYRAVVELQPGNALALNNVAWLMVKQGRPGAVAVAEKALALLPDKAPLLDTLSSAQEADNLLPQAIESQKRAIALDPKEPTFALRLARLYLKQGDKPRARAELEALAKLGERYAGQAEVATLLKSAQ